MKYRKHSELQNTYPGTTENIKDSYTEEDSQVKYTGNYSDNFVNFEIIPVTDINPGEINIADDTEFRFIVKFEGSEDSDDEYWTSPSFLEDLRDSLEKKQPYFNRETVTLLTVDYQHLMKYWLNSEFVGTLGKDGELYAEVRITETIDTKKEMLKHINWMVSSKKTDENLRRVNTFGEWELYTTDQLGFTTEQFTPGTGKIDTSELEDKPEEDRSVDRTIGSGGIRESESNITGSSVPDGRGTEYTNRNTDGIDVVPSDSGSTGRSKKRGFWGRLFGRR